MVLSKKSVLDLDAVEHRKARPQLATRHVQFGDKVLRKSVADRFGLIKELCHVYTIGVERFDQHTFQMTGLLPQESSKYRSGYM